jgi:succinate-semialdehyde dehydrogenase / glutarate-semialdehyde dehydrogenase
MDSINPATAQKIASYTEYHGRQVEEIIQQAQRSFERWRRLSYKERAVHFKKAAQVLEKNKERFARLIADEMGKPLAQGRGEIEKCAWVCEFYAQQAEVYLAPAPVKTDASRSVVYYEPLGLVFAVMPWNFPFWQVFRCAAPTLMAGNGMILKHASNVCGCALAIEEVFKEAEFPPGLFGTVLISNQKAGDLIEHPFIRAVTLTGSTGAGKSIASRAGGVVKKAVLELGGSDAYIVLEDADVDKAADICAASRLINGGQSCVSAKRFIVVDSILEKFTQKFVEKMQNQRMGSPLEEGVTVGPLARHDLRDGLHAQVERSVAEGAKLALGGKIPAGPGAFYPPTVLIDVKPGMTAYSEEMFGPVASIIAARDEKHAVAIANDSIYGLGAAVFTADTKRGERLAAEELQAGCCFVNTSVKSDPRLPFGGIKESGYGRELSSFGIQEFVNIKTVYVQ